MTTAHQDNSLLRLFADKITLARFLAFADDLHDF